MKKLSNNEIIEILKRAKSLYIKYVNDVNVKIPIGLCYCIREAYINKYNKELLYHNIKYIIPKFNRKFFKIEDKYCYRKHDYGYWWRISYTEPRIKALDKLIFYYKYKAPIYDIINKIKSIFK